MNSQGGSWILQPFSITFGYWSGYQGEVLTPWEPVSVINGTVKSEWINNLLKLLYSRFMSQR
jgi:hypothetical protein